MRITVFGASGRVGKLVVRQALEAGHTVTAFTHSNNPFKVHGGLTVLTGDVYNARQVTDALQGSEVVISTLGSWKTSKKTTVSDGIDQIITAMQNTNTKRLITLTGSGAYWSGDTLRPVDTLSHLLLKLIAPKILHDGEAHNRRVEESGLQWTIVRSPAMKDGEATAYTLQKQIGSPFAAITRATVAQAIIDQITDTSQLHQAPIVRKSGKNYSKS